MLLNLGYLVSETETPSLKKGYHKIKMSPGSIQASLTTTI